MLNSIKGSMLPKIRIEPKKASNKSCSELNFVQKFHKRKCLSHARLEPEGSKD